MSLKCIKQLSRNIHRGETISDNNSASDHVIIRSSGVNKHHYYDYFTTTPSKIIIFRIIYQNIMQNRLNTKMNSHFFTTAKKNNSKIPNVISDNTTSI